MQKFSIKTLGCKVNQYESQLIRENFLSNGFNEVNPVRNFTPANSEHNISNGVNGKRLADVYIINTCTVTGHADRECRRLIREAHRINPDAKIVITGCFVERDYDIVSKIEGVTDIVKNSDKHKLFSLITHNPTPITHNSISDFEGRTKAFIKIQDGCNNFCSFCKVPLVRGRSKSRPLEDIKREVKTLLHRGFKEIVLSGICLGEWGKDMGDGFELADVIEELEDLGGTFRIRLSSIELKYINDRLLRTITASKKVCRHLHIPLQSGDNHILKMMNRPYTKEAYLDGIMKIRSLISEVGITTDVLIGFPGEDDNNFEATLTLIKECKVHRVHAFSYSRREGTEAANITESIHSRIIKERADRLKRIMRELSYEYRKRFLNKEVEVLIESKRDRATQLLTGYTDTYIKVLLDCNDSVKSSLLKARVSHITPHHTIITI